jgi:hypothetical protein
MLVAHKGELLKKQLLEYSVGDGVRMVTRFTGTSDSEYYHFDLVSIVKLYTREATEKREAEEKKRQEAKQAAERASRAAERASRLAVKRFFTCITGILLGGVAGFVIAMIVGIPLVFICAAIELEAAVELILRGIIVIAAVVGGVVGYILAED